MRQLRLQQAETRFDPLPFDAAAARAFGHVAASLRRRGRKTSVRTYDAMIAATALANGLGIYTGNPDDFEGIDGALGDRRAAFVPSAVGLTPMARNPERGACACQGDHSR